MSQTSTKRLSFLDRFLTPWIFLAMGLALLLTNCSNPGIPATKISECDAIRIAKAYVPTRIAEAFTNSGYLPELEPHGTWFVNFADVNTTPGELG